MDSNEVWKSIDGFPNYLVSNLGNVFSLNTGKNLKAFKRKDNRLQVMLYDVYNKHCAFTIHRLVALAFIPNPDNLPQVNHKDEDPTNNIVDNLEWCNAEYNINYGTRNKRQSKTISKPVIQLNSDGKCVGEYKSIKEAHEKTGYDQLYISRCCRNEKTPSHHYTFKYA